MRKMNPSGKGSFLRSVLRALGMDKSFTSHLNASPRMGADENLRKPNNLNVQAYIIAKRRMHEIDGQKAMILHELRHDFWKAGGPV